MFCSHCGYKLEDGMQVCPECGTSAGSVSVPAGDIDVVDNSKITEEYSVNSVRKVKKKRHIAFLFIIIFIIGAITSSYYRQYRNDVKELQTYIEQGSIEEARNKADSMPKWQAQKAFDTINHDIQSENNAYIKKKEFDAGFYSDLQEKVLVLHEMEKLDEPTMKSMPDLEYCYEETLQNDELSVAEGYMLFLQEIQMDYDVSVQDKMNHAQEVRSSYESAKLKYESGSYQEALDICKAIVPDELDIVYQENTAALLKNIEEAYSKVVEENMKRAVENQDYETIYQYIKTAKDGSSDIGKYTEMENQYLEGAIKAVKSLLSYENFESAYTTCRAVAECLPDNADVINLFVETVQEYVKNLLSSLDFDTAEEILSEGLNIFPDNTELTTLQARLDNDTWRVVYEVFLSDLYGETESIEFTLYPVSEMAIPYLLVIRDNNSYEFYKYNENDRNVEMVANQKFDTYIPAEGLFFYFGQTFDKGYFSTTTNESWTGYSFDGKEFVLKYRLEKIQENHYEAITNKVLSSEDTYMKDDEVISESEYNTQVKRIESADGMKVYSYSKDNINAVIYNNQVR